MTVQHVFIVASYMQLYMHILWLFLKQHTTKILCFLNRAEHLVVDTNVSVCVCVSRSGMKLFTVLRGKRISQVVGKEKHQRVAEQQENMQINKSIFLTKNSIKQLLTNLLMCTFSLYFPLSRFMVGKIHGIIVPTLH